jgi:hypothetical protein
MAIAASGVVLTLLDKPVLLTSPAVDQHATTGVSAWALRCAGHLGPQLQGAVASTALHTQHTLHTHPPFI